MRYVSLSILILTCAISPCAAASPARVIRVTAMYPGSDARTLDETVLFPLYKQINGLEDMTRIETEARSDGSGTVSVYFEPRVDLTLAEVQVQNRVNLALPKIPEPCRQLGISGRKLPAGPPQFYLTLTSTDSSHDETFLSSYASIMLKPEFVRVNGVADVRVLNGGEFGIQVWLNPDSLAIYGLTESDVINSLRRQIVPVGAGGAISGKQQHDAVIASGRMTRQKEFESVILKANAEGEVLRLKEVADVLMWPPMHGFARVDGKPAALIEIRAWPRRVTAEGLLKIDSVGDLRPGMSLSSLTDRSTDRLLSVEVRLPGGSTLERTKEVVALATERIRELPGKPRVFALSEGHEPNAAMIFVKSRVEGGPTDTAVDDVLAGIRGAAIRVGDVPPGEEAFPVRIALIDPNNFGDPDKAREERFREAADRVLATLAKDKLVAGPAAFPELAPQRAIDVDRDKCAQFGVELNDLFTTLQTALGGVDVSQFSQYGQSFRVTVRIAPAFVRQPEDLTELKVRGREGKMISLDKLIKIRESTGPTTVSRVNGYRTINITAAPRSGTSPAEVAARCVKLAQDVLPPGYRAMDLTGP